MGWTVWGSNPGAVEIFCTCPDRPWGPPSLLYNGYRVFPGSKAARMWHSFLGVKQLGCGPDHPPPSSAEVKERVELYLYSPSGPSWFVLGWTLPLQEVQWDLGSEPCDGSSTPIARACIHWICIVIKVLTIRQYSLSSKRAPRIQVFWDMTLCQGVIIFRLF